ncbi:hypothetical protein [Streptomyces sp. NPDC029554]|uniref:hypothetical protein n=1 Tax=Streptomyces sp. NPDC029554 TaxID=3155126 RepID=UPI0034111A99
MIGVNPSMDDRRILAELEQRLSRDDPEMVAQMEALIHQFPADGTDRQSLECVDERDDAGTGEEGLRLDWRWKAILAFAVMMVAGLILTAILNRSSTTQGDQDTVNGRAPGVSVHSQGRGSRPRRRKSGAEPQDGATDDREPSTAPAPRDACGALAVDRGLGPRRRLGRLPALTNGVERVPDPRVRDIGGDHE